ncbi:helix-turn-helix transcriptional regulator [Paraburkholderia sp. Ac-20340]|uniref:helix-turn-helix domain-containing protein n=1 Tax=Paraburkholderia sp. Ac-20340 TaxID=2703888 RepID=UPI00197FC6B9|nr:helix-turn-helix transcriptional regulator [Paraburkholderia sp. Ac-20340]MBN3852828.1 helix-turn-helix transcriptional regulator [Paraburkholderia sp. Ac-20340]
MTVPLDNTTAVLRQRFGAWLREKRDEVGMTQNEMCVELDYSQPAMISQVERGSSALPEHDMLTWAALLRIPREEFTRTYLYYCRPFVYEAMFKLNPFQQQGLARPAKTIAPRPKKSALSKI